MTLRTKRIVLSLLLIIALLFIIIGVLREDITSKTIFISLGGAIMGASFSNLFNSFGFNIMEFLARKIELPVVSSGTTIEPLRKKYYTYFISVKDQKAHWRHTQEDYRNYYSGNYLYTQKSNKDDDGSQIYYESIIFAIKNRALRLVAPHKIEGPAVLCIFNNFISEYNSIKVGIGVWESWDGEDIVGPIIMSTKPIQKWTTNGSVRDKNVVRELDQIVNKSIPRMIFNVNG